MNLLLYYSLSVYLSIHSAYADPTSPKATEPPRPCVIKSESSGKTFDLNGLHIVPPGGGSSSSSSSSSKTRDEQKHMRPYSWNTTGHDYGYNFTMNFCGAVVEELKDVQGVDSSLWKNVSAYYKYKGDIYSIGQQNSELVLRGRKLVLNYTNGSPCDSGLNRRDAELDDRARTVDLTTDDEDTPSKDKSPVRRKNTIISLLCDSDATAPLLALNFVGASPDECSYFFEARSRVACGGVDLPAQTLGPGGVFGIIVLIAVLVYLVGGCVYSRTVLQQRGWRQLPNYNLWANAFSFLGDLFIILTSSCSRCLPSRRGYNRVAGTSGNGSRSRGRDSDAENRLIDELNEEWDD